MYILSCNYSKLKWLVKYNHIFKHHIWLTFLNQQLLQLLVRGHDCIPGRQICSALYISGQIWSTHYLGVSICHCSNISLCLDLLASYSLPWIQGAHQVLVYCFRGWLPWSVDIGDDLGTMLVTVFSQMSEDSCHLCFEEW